MFVPHATVELIAHVSGMRQICCLLNAPTLGTRAKKIKRKNFEALAPRVECSQGAS